MIETKFQKIKKEKQNVPLYLTFFKCYENVANSGVPFYRSTKKKDMSVIVLFYRSIKEKELSVIVLFYRSTKKIEMSVIVLFYRSTKKKEMPVIALFYRSTKKKEMSVIVKSYFIIFFLFLFENIFYDLYETKKMIQSDV